MTSLLEYFKIFAFVLSVVFAGMVYASDVEFQAGKFYYIRSGEVNFRAGPDKSISY